MSASSGNYPQESENSLLYFGDPMCSWCYGFSPEISTVIDSLPEGINFQLVMGGLRPHGKETMADLSDFLKHHWMEVHEMSGQPFTYDILQQSDFIYDTEPACRAVIVAKQIDPTKAFEFFKAVQKAFYFENKNTSELKTYLDIAKSLEIDQASFKLLYDSDPMKQATNADFQMAANMGIQSFPSLVLKKGTEYYMVARGFQKSEVILEAIERIMGE